MVIFLTVALILVVVILGVSSIMQSYSAAQQAQAQIETAQVAQMAAFANIVLIVVVSVFLLAVLTMILYILIYKRHSPAASSVSRIVPARSRNSIVRRSLPIQREQWGKQVSSDQFEEFLIDLWELIDEKEGTQ